MSELRCKHCNSEYDIRQQKKCKGYCFDRWNCGVPDLKGDLEEARAENARLAAIIRSLRANLFEAESAAAYVDRMHSGTTNQSAEVIYRARESERRAEWDAETEMMLTAAEPRGEK